MLEPEMIQQISEYMKRLEKPITIRMNNEPHEKKSRTQGDARRDLFDF